MKVICIDASPGFRSEEIPPFNEGDILEASQSPYHELDYLISPENFRGWHKKRFIPLSKIDEMEMVQVETCNSEVFA